MADRKTVTVHDLRRFGLDQDEMVTVELRAQQLIPGVPPFTAKVCVNARAYAGDDHYREHVNSELRQKLFRQFERRIVTQLRLKMGDYT